MKKRIMLAVCGLMLGAASCLPLDWLQGQIPDCPECACTLDQCRDNAQGWFDDAWDGIF